MFDFERCTPAHPLWKNDNKERERPCKQSFRVQQCHKQEWRPSGGVVCLKEDENVNRRRRRRREKVALKMKSFFGWLWLVGLLNGTQLGWIMWPVFFFFFVENGVCNRKVHCLEFGTVDHNKEINRLQKRNKLKLNTDSKSWILIIVNTKTKTKRNNW